MDQRRFDRIERVVRDERRRLDDFRSTVLARLGSTAVGGGGVTDHGALTGLSGDDHLQYHTDARGDVRYYLKATVDAALAAKAAAADLTAHTGNTSNPHAVTKTQVGLGSVDNVSAANLRDRATHAGTQSADTLTDGTTNKAFLATERTKLTGIATGATANSSDATLLARANHTGSQAQSTVTNLTTDLAGKQPLDSDLTNIAALTPTNGDLLQRVAGAWANRTIAQVKTDLGLATVATTGAYADLTGTPTAYTDEQSHDATAALFAAGTHTGVSFSYNDAGGALSATVTGGGGGVTDHGALTGLGDDDHSIYHTDARGDVRYYTKGAADTLLAGKSDTGHAHSAGDTTSGTFALARVPTGTSSSTVALGDHLHTGTYASDSHDHDSGYPKGMVAYFQRTSNSSGSSSSTGVRVCYTYCDLEAGRLYRVSAPSLGVWSTSVGHAEVKIRYTTNNTIPTSSSTVLAFGTVYIPVSGGFVFSLDVEGFFPAAVAISGFVPGIFIARVSGSASVQTYGAGEWPATILVEDMGETSGTYHGGN